MLEFATEFASASTYDAFLEAHASNEDRRRWQESFEHSVLTPAQRDLLGGFSRQMHVLCLAGAWCGDCVYQCPILQRFAEVTPAIALRFADRDMSPRLAEELRICGGARVPIVLLLSEDFQECARYGDRTLSQYKAMARAALGSGGSVDRLTDAQLRSRTTEDWLREFERVQWMLRLSPRLRRKHAD